MFSVMFLVKVIYSHLPRYWVLLALSPRSPDHTLYIFFEGYIKDMVYISPMQATQSNKLSQSVLGHTATCMGRTEPSFEFVSCDITRPH